MKGRCPYHNFYRGHHCCLVCVRPSALCDHGSGAAQQSLLLLVLCWATAALKRCPRGSFLDVVGKLVPSPDGKYWETVNYRHTAHCKLCPAGKYSNSVQSQVCTECPGGNARGGLKRYTGWTGTYSSDGATQCHACPVGKWRIHSGKSFCWVQIDEVHKTHAPMSAPFVACW